MAQVFSTMGAAADRRLNQLADDSRESFNRLKSRSLEDIYGDTKSWVRNNPGKILIGAVTTALLVGYFLKKRT
jgi:hypothetical protein